MMLMMTVCRHDVATVEGIHQGAPWISSPPPPTHPPPSPSNKIASSCKDACSCLSQKTKAPALNADPEQHGYYRVMLSKKTRAPARNANPEHHFFPVRLELENKSPC